MRLVLLLMVAVLVTGCDQWPWQGFGKKPSVSQQLTTSDIKTTKDIQIVLTNAGYYKGAIDGKASSALTQAIKLFQKNNDLVADGKVGKKTRAKLKKLIK